MESAREKVDSYQHKPFHIADFLNFCHTFPTAMFPAYEMQAHLQKLLIGHPKWVHLSQLRESQLPYKDLNALYMLCEPRGRAGNRSNDIKSGHSEDDKSTRHHSLKRGSVVPVESDALLKESGFVMPHAPLPVNANHGQIHGMNAICDPISYNPSIN